jgi:hypothetical protein
MEYLKMSKKINRENLLEIAYEEIRAQIGLLGLEDVSGKIINPRKVIKGIKFSFYKYDIALKELDKSCIARSG